MSFILKICQTVAGISMVNFTIFWRVFDIWPYCGQQGSQTSWKYALFLLVFVHYSLERERLIKDEPHLSILLLPGHLHIGLLSIPLGHSQLHATAFSQDFCAWWLPDDCKVTARWLPDDFLMTVRWLPDDSLVNVWWMPDNCLMTHVWWETTIRWQWQQNYYTLDSGIDVAPGINIAPGNIWQEY